MQYTYKGTKYNVEYAVLDEEVFDIWLQDPNDSDNYYYSSDLPENVQDELHSMVLYDVEESELSDDHNEFVGYLD